MAMKSFRFTFNFIRKLNVRVGFDINLCGLVQFSSMTGITIYHANDGIVKTWGNESTNDCNDGNAIFLL